MKKKNVVIKDYKKQLISCIIAALLVAVTTFAVSYGVFGERVQNVKAAERQLQLQQDAVVLQTSQSNSHENEKHHKAELSEQQILDIMNISTGEIVLLGVFAVAIVTIVSWYWILIIKITVKHAGILGANQKLFGILALCTNIIALLILHVYKHINRVCPKCGKIQKRGSEYCSDCGCLLDTICPKCGNHTISKTNYCSKCGNKF